ncbi:MAG: hypothetical protein DCE87_15260 [Betaproteobacteria bacterium]|nr:MAG: hypothetical protein DCE87_15260 [Betaproteobacteria bacterium]
MPSRRAARPVASGGHTGLTGFFLMKLFENRILRLVARVAIGYFTGNFLNDWIGNAGWFAKESLGLNIATKAGTKRPGLRD